MRIHITGASGTGATTLGRALAARLQARHVDADDHYWLPTVTPFRDKRPAADRLAGLRAELHASDRVVLSGSIVGWGLEVEDAFDLIVFLYLPADLRVERLRQREIEHLGVADPAFLEWAALYDEGPPEGRSLARHRAWLAQRRCPVLELDQDQSVEERVGEVLHVVQAR